MRNYLFFVRVVIANELFILYLHFCCSVLSVRICAQYISMVFLLSRVLIPPFPFFFCFSLFLMFRSITNKFPRAAVALTLREICVFIDCVIREYIFSCRGAFGWVHFYAYAATVQKRVFIHACASNAKRLIYIATTIQSCSNGTWNNSVLIVPAFIGWRYIAQDQVMIQ